MSQRQGFTLLELMVVMLMVAVLASYLAFRSGGFLNQSDERVCAARLQSVSAAIEAYMQREGAFPIGELPAAAGPSARAQNESAEALVLALFSADYRGPKPDLDWLVNSDEDRSPKPLTGFAATELFELGDPWGNPIVYIEALHYDRRHLVMAGDETYREEQDVRAWKNERTGSFERPSAFQLISAGLDGMFGTEDDITNFPRQR